MSAIPFSIIDRPQTGKPRKPLGAFRELIEALAELPDGKVIRVPASVGTENNFRSCVSAAASRVGIEVSVHKEDGCFLVMRKFEAKA